MGPRVWGGNTSEKFKALRDEDIPHLFVLIK